MPSINNPIDGGICLKVMDDAGYHKVRVPQDSRADTMYEKFFDGEDHPLHAHVFKTSDHEFKVEFELYQESGSTAIKSRIYAFTDPDSEDIQEAEGIAKRLFDML